MTSTDRFLRFVATRDQSLLDGLLREHAASAHAHALRLLRNAADADDAVQDAMLRLVRSADRFDGSVPFEAWLGRLVLHAAVDARRRTSRRSRLEQRTATEPTSATIRPTAAPDAADLVRRAVADLPDRYRTAIDLHFFAGLSLAETASALGVSTTAVASRIHRGKARLRDRMARLGVTMSLATLAAALGQRAHGAEAAAPPTHRMPRPRRARGGRARARGESLQFAAAAAFAIVAVGGSIGAVHAGRDPVASSPIAVAAVRVAAPDPAPPAAAAPARVLRSRTWDFSAGAPADVAVERGRWRFVPRGGPRGRGCMQSDGQHLVLAIADLDLRPPLRVTCAVGLLRKSPANDYAALAVWSSWRWVALVRGLQPIGSFSGPGPAWKTSTCWLTDDRAIDGFDDADHSSLRIGERGAASTPRIYLYGAQRLDRLTIAEVDPADAPDVSAYANAVLAIPPAARRGVVPLPGLRLASRGVAAAARFEIADPDARQ